MQPNKVLALSEENEKNYTWEDVIAADEAQAGQLQYENRAFLAARTLMGLFYSEDWVFITSDLLARNFIMPYIRVMKKDYVQNKLVLTPAENHPLQSLLDDPSIYGDSSAFWYRAAIYYNLLGNTFIWYMRANRKLLLLPSHEVMLKFNDRTRLLDSFMWTGGTDNITNLYNFSKEDVLHIQRPNPGSIWWGLSPFIPGHRSILFNRYSQEFINSFFERGATPQTIVETEIMNSPDAIATLAKSFELVNSGRQNFRRPLVLPKGAKATQVNMTIADQKLIELVNQGRESVINLLAIPKHAVSLQTAGSLGSEEHKTALRFMWQSTVKPMLKRFSEALSKFFKSELGDSHLIDYDTSEVDIASDEATKRTEYATGLSKTHTINEIRKLVYEMEPLPGGDIIPGVLPPPVAQNPFQGFGAGMQTNLTDVSEPAPISETATLKFSGMDKVIAHSGFAAHMKTIDEELVKTEKGMQELSTDMILSQLKKALEILKDVAPKDKAIKADWFNEAEFRRRLKDEFSYPEWKKEYVSILGGTTDVGYKTQLDLIFNRENRDAIEALQEETETQRKNILARRGLESFSQISETTSDNIIRAISLGVENQSTLPEITRALTETFSKLTFKRAQTIARTETLTAVSIGQKSAIRNAQEVVPNAKKVWITANDERVRDAHQGVHGDIVDVNDPFLVSGVKMQVPRDTTVRNHPELIINCRCTVAIVDERDVDLIDLPRT